MLFHLGPPGNLQALPLVERDGEVPVESSAPGGEFVSMTGARSRDRMGPHRRSWELPWQYLDHDTYDLLDALRAGHLDGPLHLVDPNVPNLVNRQIATGGTEFRSVVGWSTDVGARRWVRPNLVQRDVRSVGAIEWTAPTAVDVLATGRDVRGYRVPAPPQPGPITAAARIRRVDSTAPATVQAGFDWWTAASETTWTLTFASLGVPVGGEWTDVLFTMNARPEATLLSPLWRSPAGAGATFQVTGVRVAWGSAAPPPSRGGGAAIVTCADLPLTYPSEGELSFSLTLNEA